MTLTPALQRTVEDFQSIEEQDRLQLLLEFADELPDLPARYAEHPDLLERVAECQSPVFLFVEVDDSSNRMQNKIRLAQEQKVPYMLVLGDREIEARSATVRPRGAEKGTAQETLTWDDLSDRLVAEAAARGV